ncbi:MAG: WD40 repeat domain-containing protein [Egibacteraceae bacterium]
MDDRLGTVAHDQPGPAPAPAGRERSAEAAAASAAAARRRAIRLRVLVVAATIFGLLASSLALVASRSRADAVTARDAALSRQIALTAERLRATDPGLGAQLAIAGYQVAPTSEARSALLDTAVAPTSTRVLGAAGPTALAVSHQGRLNAVSNASDGTVALLDGGDRVGVLTLEEPDREIYALAFTPDDMVLAVGDTGPEGTLWDVSDPRDPQLLGDPLQGPTGPIQGLDVHPDGSELAAVGLGDGVFRWDLSDPAAPRELALLPSEVITWSVAYSPDGDHLAFGDELGGVNVWGLDGGPAPALELTVADRAVHTVVFSPEGATLAAGSRSGDLAVWDLSAAQEPKPIEVADAVFDSWVNTAVFSPDGRYLAAGSSDLDLRVWDTATWTLTQTLPHPAAVTQAAYTSEGGAIVTAAADGTLRVWDRGVLEPAGLSGSVWNIGFSPDGDRMAAFSGVDTGVWDLSDPGAPHRLGGPLVASDDGPAFTGAGAMSPDGTLLAHGTLTGEVLLYDGTDLGDPTLIGRPLGGSTELVEAVAFSADGSLLAAGGSDTAVRIWDLADPRRPRLTTTVEAPSEIVLNLSWHPRERLLAAPSADGLVYLLDLADPDEPVLHPPLTGLDSEAYGAAFHPEHEVIAIGGSDTTVILWDVIDPDRPHRIGEPVTGPAGRIFDLGFHPSGQALAAAVGDGTTWTWDTSNLAHPARTAVLGPADGQAFTVKYSPRGDLLVGSGADQRLRMWPTDEQALIEDICASAGDPVTAEEWATNVPGRGYAPPCGPSS